MTGQHRIEDAAVASPIRPWHRGCTGPHAEVGYTAWFETEVPVEKILLTDRIWRMERGDGPLVAMAVHDGCEVRSEVLRHMVIDQSSRMREEDPHTASWTMVAPTRIVGLRSRFEVDLNRPRDKAVYLTPDDAWGLEVWDGALPGDVVARSLAEYDAFYGELQLLFSELAERHGRFFVYDLHSYNHLRDGANGPPADRDGNPQVNVGTGTIIDRDRWAPVIERFIGDLSSFDFPGGALDVRENVRFRGGNCARWAHQTFPDSACVLSLEVKKFFMNEWTGEVNRELLDAVGRALISTVPGVLEELAKL
jgi:N-formylglutamate deformylase